MVFYKCEVCGFYSNKKNCCLREKAKKQIIEDEEVKNILKRARSFEFDEEELNIIERTLKQN